MTQEHLVSVCAITVRLISDPLAHEIIIQMNPDNKQALARGGLDELPLSKGPLF